LALGKSQTEASDRTADYGSAPCFEQSLAFPRHAPEHYLEPKNYPDDNFSVEGPYLEYVEKLMPNFANIWSNQSIS